MRWTAPIITTSLLLYLAAPEVVAQVDEGPGPEDDRARYLRAVAQHFLVPVREVEILESWQLEVEEVPVVLHLAARAGVSPDVLVAFRRDGDSWSSVARRFGRGADDLHVRLAEPVPGDLARVYEQFRSRPRGDWEAIELTDAEIVALVNIRVLSQALGVRPLDVLEAAHRTGDFVAAHRLLVGRP